VRVGGGGAFALEILGDRVVGRARIRLGAFVDGAGVRQSAFLCRSRIFERLLVGGVRLGLFALVLRPRGSLHAFEP